MGNCRRYPILFGENQNSSQTTYPQSRVIGDSVGASSIPIAVGFDLVRVRRYSRLPRKVDLIPMKSPNLSHAMWWPCCSPFSTPNFQLLERATKSARSARREGVDSRCHGVELEVGLTVTHNQSPRTQPTVVKHTGAGYAFALDESFHVRVEQIKETQSSGE